MTQDSEIPQSIRRVQGNSRSFTVEEEAKEIGGRGDHRSRASVRRGEREAMRERCEERTTRLTAAASEDGGRGQAPGAKRVLSPSHLLLLEGHGNKQRKHIPGPETKGGRGGGGRPRESPDVSLGCWECWREKCGRQVAFQCRFPLRDTTSKGRRNAN